MPTETDPTLYALFERTIREARDADVYVVRETRKRADGSSYTCTVELDASQKDRIPWGVVDGIVEVKWYPGGSPLHGDSRNVHITLHGFYRGLCIHSNLMHPNYPLGAISAPGFTELPGVKGTIKRLADCVEYPDEDAVVRRVHEVIEKAYQVIALEREQEAGDYEY